VLRLSIKLSISDFTVVFSHGEHRPPTFIRNNITLVRWRVKKAYIPLHPGVIHGVNTGAQSTSTGVNKHLKGQYTHSVLHFRLVCNLQPYGETPLKPTRWPFKAGGVLKMPIFGSQLHASVELRLPCSVVLPVTCKLTLIEKMRTRYTKYFRHVDRNRCSGESAMSKTRFIFSFVITISQSRSNNFFFLVSRHKRSPLSDSGSTDNVWASGVCAMHGQPQ